MCLNWPNQPIRRVLVCQDTWKGFQLLLIYGWHWFYSYSKQFCHLTHINISHLNGPLRRSDKYSINANYRAFYILETITHTGFNKYYDIGSTLASHILSQKCWKQFRHTLFILTSGFYKWCLTSIERWCESVLCRTEPHGSETPTFFGAWLPQESVRPRTKCHILRSWQTESLQTFHIVS